MRPKELLAELEKKRGDDYDNGVYDGAKMMCDAYSEEARQRVVKLKEKDPDYYAKWREANREAYNEYHRNYRKLKRELDKGGVMK